MTLSVLVAEDNPVELLLLERGLEMLGYSYVSTTDGLAAWDMLSATDVDVVISDWQMPGLDGPELCRRVRQRAESSYVYFVLLTVLHDRHHVLAGMRAGADDYLVKPLDVDDLNGRLIAASRVVRLHRRREALLRLARKLAADADPRSLFRDAVSEAAGLIGADYVVITGWDDRRQSVDIVESTLTAPEQPTRLAEQAGHLAARHRRPVILNWDWREVADSPSSPVDVAGAAVAVPIAHEGRLLGTLTAAAMHPAARFGRDDAESLELLAGQLAAAAVGMERARFDGVLLTVRTAQHELNNQLAIISGYSELLAKDPAVPHTLCGFTGEILSAATAAAEVLDRLRGIVRLREKPWGHDSVATIDLEASIEPDPIAANGRAQR